MKTSEPSGEGVGVEVIGDMTLMAVVEVNTSICCSFDKILRLFDFDFGRQSRIVTPSRVETIGEESVQYYALTTTQSIELALSFPKHHSSPSYYYYYYKLRYRQLW